MHCDVYCSVRLGTNLIGVQIYSPLDVLGIFHEQLSMTALR